MHGGQGALRRRRYHQTEAQCPRRQRPGLCAQGQQSFGQLTTAENLQVVADGRKNGKALIDEQLDLFPALKELLTRRAGLLSGGSVSSWPSRAR